MENNENNEENYYINNITPLIFKQKKILTKEEEEALLYQTYFVSYIKHQYKKVYKSIKIKNEKGINYKKQDWKFLQLKTMALQNIIITKFFRYFNNKRQTQGVKKYYYEENKIIEMWQLLISELNNNNKNTFLELLITFLLKKILNFTKICIAENHIQDAIGFLSLGEILIKKSCSFFTSPEIFTLSSTIYLYLSCFLISNENYETPIYYICNLIKYCFINLELRINDKKGIKYIFDLSKLDKIELDGIIEIFNIISIGFYYLGICYEYQDEDYIALQAYKQSKWFGNVIKDKKMKLFHEMIINLENRELMRNRLIFFFENYKEKKEKEITNENNFKKRKIFDYEKIKKLKFIKINKFIERLNIREIDDDEPGLLNDDSKQLSEKVNSSTRQINLLNYLLSEKFNDVIYGMKKLEINKLNRDTKVKIQKKIISLKNNKKLKLEKRKEKEKEKEKEDKIIYKTPIINKYKITLDNKIINLKKKKINNYNIFNEKNLSERTKNTQDISIDNNNNLNQNNTEGNYNSDIKIKIKNNIFNNNIKKLKSRNYNKINDNNYNTLTIFNKTKDNLETINNSKLNFNTTLLIKKNYLTQRNNNYERIHYNLKSYFNKNTNVKTQQNAIGYSNYIKNSISKYPIIKNNIPKYSFNKYYSSHKFLRKKGYLENQYEREIKFQKLILRMKNNNEEEEKPSQFNIIKTYKMSENFFKNTLENELNNKIFDMISNNNNNNIKKINNKKDNNEIIKNKKYIDENKIKIPFKDNLQIYNINQKSIDEITNSIAKLNLKKCKLKKHTINELI